MANRPKRLPVIATYVTSRPQNRYSNLLDDVFSLFASQDWINENFLVVPRGHITNKNVNEYAKFDIVTSSPSFKDSLAGILYVEIFTPNGLGPKRAYQIADLFDKYLAGNTFKTQGDIAVTQFKRESNFELRGEVKDNSSLLHSTFQIQFSYFRKDA